MSIPLVRIYALSLVVVLNVIWLIRTGNSAAVIQPTEPFAESSLRAGTLLIASEHLQSTLFGHAVVLVTTHDENGTIGLILNKPLLVEKPPELDLSGGDPALFFGGPVAPHMLLALIRPQTHQLFEGGVNSDIYIVMGIDDILEAAHDLTPSAQVNLYSGYAGWAPGQIETEIAEGDWIVAPLDDGAVLDIPTEDLWRTLRTRWKGYWASTIQQPRSKLS